MQIVRLTASDVSRARELLRLFVEGDGRALDVEPTDDYLRGLLGDSTFHMVVAVVDGQLVGGLTGYELPMFKKEVREMFFYEIGVADEHQNRGVGTRLVEELKKICRERGIKEIFVSTDNDNASANRLYQKTGGIAETDNVWYHYFL